jgi:hypothetical protein
VRAKAFAHTAPPKSVRPLPLRVSRWPDACLPPAAAAQAAAVTHQPNAPVSPDRRHRRRPRPRPGGNHRENATPDANESQPPGRRRYHRHHNNPTAISPTAPRHPRYPSPHC